MKSGCTKTCAQQINLFVQSEEEDNNSSISVKLFLDRESAKWFVLKLDRSRAYLKLFQQIP